MKKKKMLALMLSAAMTLTTVAPVTGVTVFADEEVTSEAEAAVHDLTIGFWDTETEETVGEFTVQVLGVDGGVAEVYLPVFLKEYLPEGYETVYEYTNEKPAQFLIGGTNNVIPVKKAEEVVEVPVETIHDLTIGFWDSETEEIVGEFTVQVLGVDGGIAEVYLPVFLKEYLPEGYETVYEYTNEKPAQFLIGGTNNVIPVKKAEEVVEVPVETIHDLTIGFWDSETEEIVGEFTVQVLGVDGGIAEVYLPVFLKEYLPEGYETVYEYTNEKPAQFLIGGDNNVIPVKKAEEVVEVPVETIHDLTIGFWDSETEEIVGEFTVQVLGVDGGIAEVYLPVFLKEYLPEGYETVFEYTNEKPAQFLIGGTNNVIPVKKAEEDVEVPVEKIHDLTIGFWDNETNKTVGEFTVKVIGVDGGIAEVYLPVFVATYLPEGYETVFEYTNEKPVQFLIGGDNNVIPVKKVEKDVEVPVEAIHDLTIGFWDSETEETVGEFTVKVIGVDGGIAEVYLPVFVATYLPEGYETVFEYTNEKPVQFLIGGDNNVIPVKRAKDVVEVPEEKIHDLTIGFWDNETNKTVGEFTVQVLGVDGGIAEVYLPVFVDKYLPEGYETVFEYTNEKPVQFLIGGDNNVIPVKKVPTVKKIVVAFDSRYGKIKGDSEIILEEGKTKSNKAPSIYTKKGSKYTNLRWCYKGTKGYRYVKCGKTLTFDSLENYVKFDKKTGVAHVTLKDKRF